MKMLKKFKNEKIMRRLKTAFETRAKKLAILQKMKDKEIERRLDEISSLPKPFNEVIFESNSRLLLEVVKTRHPCFAPLKYLILMDVLSCMKGCGRLIHIGGWAAYFMYLVGKGKYTTKWRGSHDIDSIDVDGSVSMFNLKEVKHLFLSKRKSTSIMNKWSISFGLKGEVFPWDVYYLSKSRIIIEGEEFHRDEISKHAWNFGNSKIINPIHLLILKLRANRPKDLMDISTILTAIERVGEFNIALEIRKILELDKEIKSIPQKVFNNCSI